MIGKSVKINNQSSMYYGKTGTVDFRADWSSRPVFKIIFNDTQGDWSYFEEHEFDVIGVASDGCECGCSAVGSPRHYYFCRLYIRWEDEKET